MRAAVGARARGAAVLSRREPFYKSGRKGARKIKADVIIEGTSARSIQGRRVQLHNSVFSFFSTHPFCTNTTFKYDIVKFQYTVFKIHKEDI